MEAEPTTVAAVVLAIAHLARPIVHKGCDFAESLLGETMKAAGGMIADQIYGWQLTNRVKVAARAKDLCDEKGIPPRTIATGFLLPFFEAAGNVDDPELQELWASLLASAVAGDASQHPLFVQTLRAMNGDDARVFRTLVTNHIPEHQIPFI